jgi:nucleotide-binding universal stress UspA family protein
MIDTTTSAGHAPAPTNHTATGPIVAAIGGLEPESVLRAARMFGLASTGGVVAVSALPPLPVTVIGESVVLVPPSYEDERYADCMASLENRLEAFGGAARTWKRRVVRGEPASALTALARELHASMLVMGIGRHRPLDRILGAETALRAIRRAPCPVLVVHPDLDGPFHDVVVATDFSPASAAAAQAMVPLLGLGATVHVVHVWEPSNSDDPRLTELDEQYVQSLPERFQRFTDLLDVASSVEIKTVTRDGKPAERVLDYARTHHADLIVAGRHGRSLLERLLVGSQTTALVRAADRSVLIAPEPAFAESDRLRLLQSGATLSHDPAEWQAQLRALSQRNSGRRTVLEVEDVAYGSQVIESGFVLLGTTYDPRTKRLEFTLGDEANGARHVTHIIGAVDSVAIAADSSGRDVGLRINHGGGQTALTFLGD